MSGLICDVCIGGAQILLGGYIVFSGIEYIQNRIRDRDLDRYCRVVGIVSNNTAKSDCCSLVKENEIEMPELKSVSEKKNEEKSNNNNNNSRAAEKEKEE